jgi:hypothetical protein
LTFKARIRNQEVTKMQQLPGIQAGSINQKSLASECDCSLAELRIACAWAGVRGLQLWDRGPVLFSREQAAKVKAWVTEHRREGVPA